MGDDNALFAIGVVNLSSMLPFVKLKPRYG